MLYYDPPFKRHAGRDDVNTRASLRVREAIDFLISVAHRHDCVVSFCHHYQWNEYPNPHRGSSFYQRGYTDAVWLKEICIFTDGIDPRFWAAHLSHEVGHLMSDDAGTTPMLSYARLNVFRKDLTDEDKKFIIEEEERAWINGSNLLGSVVPREDKLFWEDFASERDRALRTYYAIKSGIEEEFDLFGETVKQLQELIDRELMKSFNFDELYKDITK